MTFDLIEGFETTTIARWDQKEAAGKALARRIEIAYEAVVLVEKANIIKVRYKVNEMIYSLTG